jgi:ABC-2 type transport system permease protein
MMLRRPNWTPAARAFLEKELRVALGQRRLLLALVVGPFLLLLFFGIGFTGSRRQLQALLVVPDQASVPQNVFLYQQFFHWSMTLSGISTDPARALTALENGEVDLVILPPRQPLDDLTREESAVFRVVYKDLDPLEEAQLNALAYGHSRELNARLVELVFQNVLPAANVEEGDRLTTGLRTALAAGDEDGALALISRFLAGAAILRASGQPAPGLSLFEEHLRGLRADVAGGQGRDPATKARLDVIDQIANVLPPELALAGRLSPARLATPSDYELVDASIRETSYVRHYAPVVLALLLQHMGVALAGLSVTRERLRGTTELFAVAPISPLEIQAGKSLSFVALAGVVALVLTLVVRFVLDVPFIGSPFWAAAVFILLGAIAVSVGFIIATLAGSETQTVQLSMLVLLFSVFFGGLFIPVASLAMPVRLVGLLVPVTHAGGALRAVMLRGEGIPFDDAVWLLGTAAITIPLSYLLFRTQLRFQR